MLEQYGVSQCVSLLSQSHSSSMGKQLSPILCLIFLCLSDYRASLILLLHPGWKHKFKHTLFPHDNAGSFSFSFFMSKISIHKLVFSSHHFSQLLFYVTYCFVERHYGVTIDSYLELKFMPTVLISIFPYYTQ